MFRRKEDSLFDTDSSTDSTETTGSGSAAPVSSGSATGSSSSSSSAPVSAYGASSSSSSAPSAPRSSSTSGFRSNTGATSVTEAPRSRASESKAGSSESKASAAPVSSFVSVEKGSGPHKSSGRRVLTVGNDILLKGEIATCDRLVIEGKVDATLNDVHTVEIAENGSFKGSAQIEDAEISGLFEGDLIVRNRLVIYATGKVRGKISYGEIEIERGGELTGEIKTTTAAPAIGTRSSRVKEVAA